MSHQLLHQEQNKWQKLTSLLIDDVGLNKQCAMVNSPALSINRWLVSNLLVFLLQYVGLMLTTLTPQMMPVYFSTGIACAFVFMRGYQITPGIWLGTFVAYFLQHASVWVAISCAMLFTLQPIILLAISYRFISPTLIVLNKRHFFSFALIAMLTASLISTIQLWLTYPIWMTETVWLSYWLANVNGVFVIAYGILTLDMYFPQLNNFTANKQKKAIISYVLLAVLCSTMIVYPVCWPVVIAMVIALGMKYRWPGLVLANFIVGLFITLAAYLGWYHASLAVQSAILMMGLMLGVV